MTNEESEQCPRLCGNCVRFSVLDDQPGDPCKWFGVCDREVAETLEDVGITWDDVGIDWIYDHGRHGQDDCEKPDEWFEEG